VAVTADTMAPPLSSSRPAGPPDPLRFGGCVPANEDGQGRGISSVATLGPSVCERFVQGPGQVGTLDTVQQLPQIGSLHRVVEGSYDGLEEEIARELVLRK
jgi:hypothetical protein